MSKPKVIVTRRWPEEIEAELTGLYDVELNIEDKPMDADTLRTALGTADAVLPTVTDPINAEVLAAEPLRTRILGNFGVGFNHIDLEAAKARGITVTNTPEVLTDCTADIAMTLLLMSARRAGQGERHVRSGSWIGWRPTHMLGTQVTGKTLGLIGMGRIAKAVAARAHHGFGMNILFHDPFPPPREVAQSLGATACDSIEDVLSRSDYVSLHCPGGKETHHLINAERLGLMKPGAHLINTARGDVIDEQALVAALKAGTIAGAGLDVHEREPKVSQALIDLENTVLLPHLGSASTETRVAMGRRVLENLGAFFAEREPRDRVA